MAVEMQAIEANGTLHLKSKHKQDNGWENYRETAVLLMVMIYYLKKKTEEKVTHVVTSFLSLPEMRI